MKLRDADAGTLTAHSFSGAYRRKSVIENTRIRMTSPNKPSSIMLPRKMLAPSSGPDSAFCEAGGFQSNHQHAPNRGNQTHHQERLGDQNMRVNGNAHRMHNLHHHQHDEQLIQHQQCIGGNRPVANGPPKHFSSVGNRRQRRYEKQNGKNGINKHFGLCQIVAKVMAKFFFSHVGVLAESRCCAVLDGGV